MPRNRAYRPIPGELKKLPLNKLLERIEQSERRYRRFKKTNGSKLFASNERANLAILKAELEERQRPE